MQNFWEGKDYRDSREAFQFSNGFSALDMQKWLQELYGKEIDFSKQLIIHYLKKLEELGYFFSVKELNPSTGKQHTIYYLHWWWNIIRSYWSNLDSFKDSWYWNRYMEVKKECFEVTRNYNTIWYRSYTAQRVGGMMRALYQRNLKRSRRDFPHFWQDYYNKLAVSYLEYKRLGGSL